jgi:purine-cytosine permease-like protein
VGVGGLCFALAVGANIGQYENFLFLIGSLFVPLFGVLAADYFILRRRYDPRDLYDEAGAHAGVHWPGVLAWALGFAAYQLIVPTDIPAWKNALGAFCRALGLPFPLSGALPWLGASVPSFALALVLYLIAARIRRRADRR